jgi:hypothetical protein
LANLQGGQFAVNALLIKARAAKVHKPWREADGISGHLVNGLLENPWKTPLGNPWGDVREEIYGALQQRYCIAQKNRYIAIIHERDGFLSKPLPRKDGK